MISNNGSRDYIYVEGAAHRDEPTENCYPTLQFPSAVLDALMEHLGSSGQKTVYASLKDRFAFFQVYIKMIIECPCEYLNRFC